MAENPNHQLPTYREYGIIETRYGHLIQFIVVKKDVKAVLGIHMCEEMRLIRDERVMMLRTEREITALRLRTLLN